MHHIWLDAMGVLGLVLGTPTLAAGITFSTRTHEHYRAWWAVLLLGLAMYCFGLWVIGDMTKGIY